MRDFTSDRLETVVLDPAIVAGGYLPFAASDRCRTLKL